MFHKEGGGKRFDDKEVGNKVEIKIKFVHQNLEHND